MNRAQSIQVLEQALNIANQKGCYSLKDSGAIYMAWEFFINEFRTMERTFESKTDAKLEEPIKSK